MSRHTMQVDVVSAEEQVYSGHASFVILPAEMGELGIYPHHAPLLTRIKPGTVRIQNDGKPEEQIFVSGGILEIDHDGVTVLADTAIRGHDLDEARALEAKRLAEELLQDQATNIDHAKATAELSIAVAQLALIQKLRRTSH